MVNLITKSLFGTTSNEKKISKHPGLAGLLIDMQSDCLQVENIDPQDKNQLIASQIEVINYFSENNIPIIDITTGFNSTVKPLRRELRKTSVIRYRKRNFNAFSIGYKNIIEYYPKGYLTKILTDMNVDNLFLMGLYASKCVYETAVGGVNEGFTVSTANTVIADSKLASTYWKNKRKDIYLESKINYYISHKEFLDTLKS